MRLLILLLTLLTQVLPAAPVALVPCYDLSYAPDVCKAAESGRLAVVVNVDSGPGAKSDAGWLAVYPGRRCAARVW